MYFLGVLFCFPEDFIFDRNYAVFNPKATLMCLRRASLPWVDHLVWIRTSITNNYLSYCILNVLKQPLFLFWRDLKQSSGTKDCIKIENLLCEVCAPGGLLLPFSHTSTCADVQTHKWSLTLSYTGSNGMLKQTQKKISNATKKQHKVFRTTHCENCFSIMEIMSPPAPN